MNSTREQARENLEPLDTEAAMDALIPHQQLKGLTARDAIEVALEAGELTAYRTTIETYLSLGWQQQCKWAHGRRKESSGHFRRKLAIATFLDELGHKIDRMEDEYYDDYRENIIESSKREYLDYGNHMIPNPDLREWIYSASNFERHTQGRKIDVACQCEDCQIYGEAGKNSYRKLHELLMVPDHFDEMDALVVSPYEDGFKRGRDPDPYPFYIYLSSDRDVEQVLWATDAFRGD